MTRTPTCVCSLKKGLVSSMVSIERMRAECVRHYVERRHSPEHADLIVPKDEAEIRRIYECIQEEKKRGLWGDPNTFPNLITEETAAE